MRKDLIKSIANETDQQLSKLCSSVDVKTQENILISLGGHLEGWELVKNIADCNINKILWTVWDCWENSVISPGATGIWDYNFYTWAQAFFKERLQYEPVKETIDNRIRVYRDWIAQPVIEGPAIVYLPPRDERGKIVSHDSDEWIKIDSPSFDEISYSKLLVARGTARKGKMSPDAWSALFDTHASVRDLKEEIKKEKTKNKDTDDFRLFEEDGIIYAFSQGEVVPLSHLLVENINSPLWRRGVNQLLGGVEIHTPLIYQNA